MLNMIV